MVSLGFKNFSINIPCFSITLERPEELLQRYIINVA